MFDELEIDDSITEREITGKLLDFKTSPTHGKSPSVPIPPTHARKRSILSSNKENINFHQPFKKPHSRTVSDFDTVVLVEKSHDSVDLSQIFMDIDI